VETHGVGASAVNNQTSFGVEFARRRFVVITRCVVVVHCAPNEESDWQQDKNYECPNIVSSAWTIKRVAIHRNNLVPASFRRPRGAISYMDKGLARLTNGFDSQRRLQCVVHLRVSECRQ